MAALAVGRRPQIESEALADATRLCLPYSLQLALTDRCNLRCAHCYCVPGDRPELTTDEVADLLDQAAVAGTFTLLLTGGEALCRPDLPAILARAQALRFAVKLYTNATLLDDAAADVIAERGVHEVHVSVFSADAAVHDAITGAPGSLAASLAAVRRLRDRGVRVMLKCVIMRPNLASFRSGLRLAEELGTSCAYDPVVSVRVDGGAAPLALRLGRDELVTVFATPEIAAAAGREAVPDEFPRDGEMADAPPCAAGWSNCAVSACGDVTPCVAWPAVAGNVREAPLAEIWSHAPLFRRVRQTRNRDLAVCAGCADLGRCSRCPGSALLEDGSVDGPSRAACLVAAARREASGREMRP